MWDLTIHPLHGSASHWHSFLSSMWDLTIHPLRSLASSLAHRSVSTPFGASNVCFGTICNSSSLPLADMVIFGFFLSGFPSKVYNASAGERFSHPYKKCFVLLSNRCGISQSTPLRDPASSLALIHLSNRCGISQ